MQNELGSMKKNKNLSNILVQYCSKPEGGSTRDLNTAAVTGEEEKAEDCQINVRCSGDLVVCYLEISSKSYLCRENDSVCNLFDKATL